MDLIRVIISVLQDYRRTVKIIHKKWKLFFDIAKHLLIGKKNEKSSFINCPWIQLHTFITMISQFINKRILFCIKILSGLRIYHNDNVSFQKSIVSISRWRVLAHSVVVYFSTLTHLFHYRVDRDWKCCKKWINLIVKYWFSGADYYMFTY